MLNSFTATAHTPGPWVVDNSGASIHSVYLDLKPKRVHGYGFGDNGFICDLNDGEYHGYVDAGEQAANARLIAAAPELLKACKLALTRFQTDGWPENHDNTKAISLLFTAIDKAESPSA